MTMSAKPNKTNTRRAGFTLVELLMALMVTAIILSAVATLAFALTSGVSETDEISANQAALRFATVKLGDLIRNSRHAMITSSNDIALWRSDDNNDNAINAAELVYIEADTSDNSLKLLEFPNEPATVTIAEIENGTARSDLISIATERFATLFPECYSMQMTMVNPKLVDISFQLMENEVLQSYQISAARRCSAANLIDTSGQLVSGDDD
ncbi:MAG TPA: type II secretion system protein [Phycisphaerales bacterium]|nr:type II secretion system protein [Phycisphaerales bacterium]